MAHYICRTCGTQFAESAVTPSECPICLDPRQYVEPTFAIGQRALHVNAAGGTVLHWAAGAEGRGALLAGDILQVGQDRRSVSVMYSYPNYIPVSAATVRRIAGIVAALEFDEVYSAWSGRNIIGGARQAVEQSLDRYCRAVLGER